ncbi:MAG: hypothetical protein WC755_05370 [Candidatus Woesearchaeota archaeon]
MKTKKAQVTIFIILGLLLLSATTIVLYVKNTSNISKLETDFETAVSQRPNQLKMVSGLVDSCLLQTTKEAFDVLSEKGGYIYPNIPRPIEGQFVDSKGVIYYDSVLPYYTYVSERTGSEIIPSEVKINIPMLCKSSSVSCEYKTDPTNDKFSIEGQIERYVRENINFCINDFKSIEKFGYSVSVVNNISVNIQIRNSSEDVLVRADYPLIVTYEGATATIDKFQNNYDIDFYSFYEFLYKFTKTESSDGFLEQHTLNLMDSLTTDYSIVPYYEEMYEPKIKKWNVDQVLSKIAIYLDLYTSSQKIKYTSNWESPVVPDSLKYKNPVQARLMDLSYELFLGENMWDYEIKFIYDKDKFDKKLWMGTDEFRTGNSIEATNVIANAFDFLPNKITNLIESVADIYEVSSSYFVSYPVVVSIKKNCVINSKDPATCKDYSFIFAMESNIVYNQAVPTIVGSSMPGKSLRSLYCNDDLRTINVSFTVLDNLTKLPVENAEAYYTCIFQTCNLDKTDASGVLKNKLQSCGAGHITLKAEGYMDLVTDFSLVDGINYKKTFAMDPIITHNVTFKKLRISDINKFINSNSLSIARLLSTAKDLDNKDQVIFTVVREPETEYDEQFSQDLLIRGPGKQSISLVSGKYQIISQLLRYDDVYIPMEFDRTCTGGGEQDSNRCKKVGRVSEKLLTSGNHPLGGQKFNPGSDEKNICKDEPNSNFWHVQLAFYSQYKQKESCNQFVNDYAKTKLPEFTSVKGSDGKWYSKQGENVNTETRMNAYLLCDSELSNLKSFCYSLCTPTFDGNGDPTNEYKMCMNSQARRCMEDNSDPILAQDFVDYKKCIDESKFCNQVVKWNGNARDPTYVYAMSDHDYRTCNLKYGYICLGLDFNIKINDSKGINNEDDVDEEASVTPGSLNGEEIYQFGQCDSNFSGITENTNLESTSQIIAPINLTGNPIFNGGFMAVNATGFLWNYQPYIYDRYKKDITIYLIEYDQIPSNYEDFNQQAYLFDYSKKIGDDLSKSFLR